MAATETTKADDGEALQSLFANYCDQDGLMTKETLASQISAIRELLVCVCYFILFCCFECVHLFINVCIVQYVFTVLSELYGIIICLSCESYGMHAP